MNWLLAPASIDDLIRLLKAWRFLLLATLAGIIFGTAFFFIVPPPFRARATVLVDHNLEQSWPEEPDRKLFFYMERETRKLRQIAWSDATMEAVSQVGGIPVEDLREGALTLSQPGEGGWHLYADHKDPGTAAEMASTWAQTFAEQVEKVEEKNQELGLNQNIQVWVTQSANLPVHRRTPISIYILAGSVITLVISSLLMLFIHPKDRTGA
jgi:capsular polysaccharide biosynthesis protein